MIVKKPEEVKKPEPPHAALRDLTKTLDATHKIIQPRENKAAPEKTYGTDTNKVIKEAKALEKKHESSHPTKHEPAPSTHHTDEEIRKALQNKSEDMTKALQK